MTTLSTMEMRLTSTQSLKDPGWDLNYEQSICEAKVLITRPSSDYCFQNGEQCSGKAGDWLLSDWLFFGKNLLIQGVMSISAAILVILKSGSWALLYESLHKTHPCASAVGSVSSAPMKMAVNRRGWKTHFTRDNFHKVKAYGWPDHWVSNQQYGKWNSSGKL